MRRLSTRFKDEPTGDNYVGCSIKDSTNYPGEYSLALGVSEGGDSGPALRIDWAPTTRQGSLLTIDRLSRSLRQV